MISNDLGMLIVNYQWYHNGRKIHFVWQYQLNSNEQKNFVLLTSFEKVFYLLEYTKHIDSIMTDMKNTFLLNCIVLEEERVRWPDVSFLERFQFTYCIAEINY